jgi:cobalt/nickel transport system permease protein
LLYLAAVITATLIHHPLWLGSGLLLVLLIAQRDAITLLRRAVLTVLAFNTLISLSYLGMAWWQDISPWQTLLRLNLRVLLLTCLTFLFIARTNLFQALDFSKNLTYVLGLAYSQTLTFRRAHDDFRLALASRSLTRPSLRRPLPRQRRRRLLVHRKIAACRHAILTSPAFTRLLP